MTACTKASRRAEVFLLLHPARGLRRLDVLNCAEACYPDRVMDSKGHADGIKRPNAS